MSSRLPISAGLLTALSLCVGAAYADDVAPAKLAHVDMERMYGGWYMIATIPNSFEKGIVAPYDVYSKRPDGDIQEDFYFLEGSFAAEKKHFTVHDWVLPNTDNASWRVQVFWPINLPFLVLYTDPRYRYVIFGEADRKLGWIYSRTQTIPNADFDILSSQLRALGYDPTKFVKFVQTPDQLGQPGFWSDGIR